MAKVHLKLNANTILAHSNGQLELVFLVAMPAVRKTLSTIPFISPQNLEQHPIMPLKSADPHAVEIWRAYKDICKEF